MAMFTGTIKVELSSVINSVSDSAVVSLREVFVSINHLTESTTRVGEFKMRFTGKPYERVYLTYHGIPASCDRIRAFTLSTKSYTNGGGDGDISIANGLSLGYETFDTNNTTATSASSKTQTIYFNLDSSGEKLIYAKGHTTPGDGHDNGIAVLMTYYEYEVKLIMPENEGEWVDPVIEIKKK